MLGRSAANARHYASCRAAAPHDTPRAPAKLQQQPQNHLPTQPTSRPQARNAIYRSRSSSRLRADAGITLDSVTVERRVSSTSLPVTSTPGHKDVRFISFQDGRFTVQGHLTLAAPLELVSEVLSDYEGAARIFHNIASSSVQRNAPDSQGHKSLLVTQTCRWSFLAFSGHFDCSFLVSQDEETSQFDFKLQKSSFMRDFQGNWRLQPAAVHQEAEPTMCMVEHTLSVKPLMDVPEPIAQLTSGIFLQQVSCILDDLAREVNRRQLETA